MLLVSLNGAILGSEEGMYALTEHLVHDIYILLHEDTGDDVGLHVPVSFGPALKCLR